MYAAVVFVFALLLMVGFGLLVVQASRPPPALDCVQQFGERYPGEAAWLVRECKH